MDIGWQDNVGVQINTNGVTDNSGQFSIQVTIDGKSWEPVVLSPPIPSLSDADAQIFCNLNQLPFKKLRVAFSAAGGSPDGACSVWIMAKAV